MGISCRRVSVRPSVTSRCSTKTAKHRITQTTPYDSPGTLVFCCRKSRQNSNGVTANGGAKCRCGRLNAAEVAENRRLSTRSVVNLARTQVYHTERPPSRSPCCRASRGICQRQLILVYRRDSKWTPFVKYSRRIDVSIR